MTPDLTRAELDQRRHELLDAHARQLGITFYAQSISGRFGELIREATRLSGQRTVVLIDEYDKPILDNLGDREVAATAQVFVFEFKVVEQAAKGEALQQIKAQGYADKYRGRGEPVHLIGVEFSRAARNLVGFETETRPPMQPHHP